MIARFHSNLTVIVNLYKTPTTPRNVLNKYRIFILYCVLILYFHTGLKISLANEIEEVEGDNGTNSMYYNW